MRKWCEIHDHVCNNYYVCIALVIETSMSHTRSSTSIRNQCNQSYCMTKTNEAKIDLMLAEYFELKPTQITIHETSTTLILQFHK